MKSESESHSVGSDSLWPHGPYSPWNFPGQNTGVSSLSLLQGIFPIQGSNPGFLYSWWILCQLSHKGRPRILVCIAYPFSSRSFRPRNRTGSPTLQVDSLPTEHRKKVKSLSRVRLFVTPWTVVCQAPPSMGFFRQEYWEWVAISFSRGSSWLRD